MKGSYIRLLTEFLPDSSRYFVQNGVVGDRPGQIALAMNDSKFGWNFVRALKADGVEFPEDITHPQLVQASDFLNGVYDEVMEEVLSIAHPINTTKRIILKGLLISRDVTLAGIADFMKMSLEVARMFDQVIFNARDRLDDPGFIAQLLNPAGIRLDRETNNEELLMLHAGYRYGAGEVVRLARIKLDDPRQSPVDLGRNLEREIFEAAAAVIRHGGAQDMNSPAVAAATKLLIADKRVQRDEPRPSIEADALSNLHKFNPIMETLERLQQPGITKMLQTARDDPGQKHAALDPNWMRY